MSELTKLTPLERLERVLYRLQVAEMAIKNPNCGGTGEIGLVLHGNLMGLASIIDILEERKEGPISD